MNILIPMAGLATRFLKEGINTPKPLIVVGGKTLIEHTTQSLGIEGRYIFITRKYTDSDYNRKLSELLKSIYPNCIEICLSSPTRGSVETCLAAKEYINDGNELIVTNCDQITEWDSNSFKKFCSSTSADGVVVTYTSRNPKNSFAEVDSNGNITKIEEKNPISDKALIGVHYWRRGSDFILSAEKLMKLIEKLPTRECYVSETYNHLIEEGLTIKSYHIPENEYISLGTPYDVSIYTGRHKEYNSPKPKTIFCDIDGTILNHVHKFSLVAEGNQTLLQGVQRKFDEWDSSGHKIILCTARKESARNITESHLMSLGICWDQLIMGLTSGERILINDKLSEASEDRAKSVNVTTNKGFTSIDWNKNGL